VAVEEGLELRVLAEEGLIDGLGGQRGGQREIAARDALGQAQQVGRDVLLLAGEHGSRAPEPDRHLVADEQHAELVAQLAHRSQVAPRVHEDAGGPLHQGLDDDSRHAARVRFQEPAHVRGIARLRLPGVEEQRAERRVEEVDAAHRDRADGVAVVGVAQADEAGPLRLAAVLPVLERDLDGHFGRRRAVVRVEDALKPRGRQLGQALGELDGGRMREPEHGRVGDAVELGAHGRVDDRVAVPMDVAPQGGDAVDVGVSVGVVERGAGRALDQQGLLARPPALLRERMPEVAAVGVGEGGGVHGPEARWRPGRRPPPY
jgi:hypothetical protein